MSTHHESTAIISPGWTFSTALQLGRVSNLPTVWTNTVVGILLVGATATAGQLLLLLVAMSLAYIAGMYLNDAFDRHIDASERPERPIPSGKVTAREVFVAGFSMLGAAIALITAVGSTQSQGLAAFSSSTALAVAIIVYNLWHKGNPLSPILMGLCRLLVYLTCALALKPALSTILILGSFITFSYLIGLTYTAKQEKFGHVSTLWPLACLAAPVVLGVSTAGSHALIVICTAAVAAWTLYCLRLVTRRGAGDIPKAVTGLIAGIALIDALLVAIAASTYGFATGSTLLIISACWVSFGLTLKLQRYVAGT